MSTVVFPSSIIPNYTLTKTPIYRTNVITYGNNVEQRIALDSIPQHKFTLTFDVLTYAQKTAILDFYNARQGSFDSFFLANPDDALNCPTWSSSTSFSTGYIIRSTLSSLAGHTYKVITYTSLNGTTVPAFTTVRNATFTDGGVVWQENSYKVRFETDQLNFEYFDYQLYSLGTITFLEVST